MSIENQNNLGHYVKNCRELVADSSSKIKPKDFVSLFSNLAQLIIDNSINFVEESYSRQKENDTIDDVILVDQIIVFELTREIKNFLFLIQDSYIQINKARILYQESTDENNNFGEYFVKCMNHINKGIAEVETFFNDRLYQLQNDSKARNKFEIYVLHNINPWTEYQSQFIELKDQIIEVEKRFVYFDKIFVHIQGVKKTITENIENLIGEIKNINDTFIRLENLLTTVKIADSSQSLKDNMFYLEQNIHSNFHLEDFSYNIELDIEHLNGELQYPIKTKGGKVLTLTLSLKRRILSWLKNKIYPNLSDIWGKIEMEQNGMRITLHNLALLAVNKNTLEDVDLLELKSNMEEIISPFKQKIKKSDDFIYSTIEKINKSLAEDITISLIYKENRYFLFPETSPKEFAYGVAQNTWMGKLIYFFNTSIKGLNIAFLQHKHERSLSYSERLVRYINSQNIKERHSKYMNLYTAKGYISDTFTVGLEAQIAKIENSINMWKSGFQGSVMITGGRLIGKTLLGEKIASRFFLNNVYRLSPEMILKIGNNTLNVDGDLLKTLNYIRYFGQKNPLIWIDDIELWNSSTNSLARNIQSLDQFVRFHSNSFFVMVSMNSITKKRSQAFGLLNDAFQTEISIDNYSYKDFLKALSVKHYSTYYQLVDKKGDLISNAEIKKIIKKIFLLSNGVIGNGIQLWASRCLEVSDERVEYDNSNYYALPDFLSSEMKIIINTVYLKKRILESELEILFGRQYILKYAQIVQKLVSVGVLVKTSENWISINECMASDISIQLNESNIK